MGKPIKQEFFNKIAEEFDAHVRASIPLYNEYVNWLVGVIKKEFAGKQVLDLMGSSAYLGKLLSDKKFDGFYTNLDGSPSMINEANKRNLGGRYKNILGGFMASWFDEHAGKWIHKHSLPSAKYDVVVENLGFQFTTQTREKEVDEVLRSMKPNGCAIFCEKFNNKSQALYGLNEKYKDENHKLLSFTQEDIDKKKKSVLIDMGEHQVYLCDFIKMLTRKFRHVKVVYKAGNFAAVMCTNAKYFNHSIDKKLVDNEWNRREVQLELFNDNY